MELSLILLVLLVLGLGLFQVWLLWYVKREVARLERRLEESLDDEDLLDFQERLQGLLDQAKHAGLNLVDTVDRREAALEKALDRIREAERRLASKAETLERAVEEAHQRAESLRAEGPKPKAPAKAAPRKPSRPEARVERPAAVEKPEPPVALSREPVQSPPADESVDEIEARRRSYLVRPAPTPAAPSRYQKIYDLADQGLNREQIAREAGVLPGEIDLILNLRPQRRDQG